MLINYYGGPQFVPAEVATALSPYCSQQLVVDFGDYTGQISAPQIDYISDPGDMGGAVAQPDVVPVASTSIPAWTADVPAAEPPIDSNSHSTDQTIIPLWSGPLEEGPVLDETGLFGGTAGPSGDISGFFGGIQDVFTGLEQFFQKDQFNFQAGPAQITAGLTAHPNRPCKMNRRMKVALDSNGTPRIVPAHPKVVIGADGKPTVVFACPPRRMNPLNPRALGRAARRLAGFHRISSHIEKIVQHACRPKRRSARMPSFGRSCGPRRKGRC